MTYVVGLTGGIGSGKTTVSNYFATLGTPIIDLDLLARDVVAPGSSAFIQITEHFGSSIVTNQGQLNRALLRNIIFNSPNEKIWLESLVHPLIDAALVNQVSQISAPYCIVVIPLLAEHFQRYQSLLDEVIVISTFKENQIKWAQARDGNDIELLTKMIHSQATTSMRLKIADHLLENTGSISELETKIRNLHQNFIQKKSTILR